MNAQDVYVHGYYRKNGTYVQPHYRSHPDGNPYNNWSFPGNTNPYTGKTATGNPRTYLNNYYNNSSKSPNTTWNSNSSTYNYPSTDYHSTSTFRNNYYKTSTSTYLVTANSLNVRSGPSTDYSKIGSLSYTDMVTVLRSYENGWKKIKFEYYDTYTYDFRIRIGYVFGSYLSSMNSYSSDDYIPNSNYNSDDYYNLKTSSSPYGYGNGKITFWTDCGTDGLIRIYLNGDYIGTLTKYFSNGSPHCGSTGTIAIIKPAGSYFVKAEGDNRIWNGTVTITEDRCTIEGIRK